MFPSPHAPDTAVAGMDAEYIYGRPGTGSICAQYAWPHRWGNFQVNNSTTWRHPETLGGVQPRNVDHQYFYALLGHGVPAQFRLKDQPNTTDNSGRLKITIRKANGGDCYGGGYTQFGFGDLDTCRTTLGGIYVIATVP
jgi:hypothetical protein